MSDSGQVDRHQSAPRPVRVGYIVHSFHMGGLERCVARLCNHLDPQRFDPYVVCLTQNGDAADWISRPGVSVFALQKPEGQSLRVMSQLGRILAEQQTDVIHSHNWGTLLETVFARRWVPGALHVHAERGTELAEQNLPRWKRRIRGLLTRWALGRADRVIAVADATRRNVFAECGYPAERIEVIPNGVERPAVADAVAARKRIRDELGLRERDVLVGSVGRLAGVKGFDQLIDAVGRAGDPNLHLVLVGDGPERERLAAAARTAGADPRVHLVGQRDNVGDWLAALDIYANSSISEGTSQAVLEAMSFGIPLVVTDVGDHGRVVGGDSPCGRVVAPGDVDLLAAALDDLAADERMRAEFGRAALLRHAESFSAVAMVQSYERLYASLSGRGTLAVPGAAASCNDEPRMPFRQKMREDVIP